MQHLLPKGREGVGWEQGSVVPGSSAGSLGETLPLQLGGACTAPSEDPYFEDCCLTYFEESLL